MSAPTSARSARAPLPPSVTRPASPTAKGYRVIRPVRPAATAPAPQPGLLARLWQRLSAALRITPEEMDAQQRTQHSGSGDVRPRVVTLSGGRLVLLPSTEAPAPRRFAQPDLQ